MDLQLLSDLKYGVKMMTTRDENVIYPFPRRREAEILCVCAS